MLSNRPTELALLDEGARPAIKHESFLLGAASPDFSPFTRPFSRPISLRPLTCVIDEAMDRFADDVVGSDAWLAPRVFAALRLTLREAGQRALWQYLAAVVYPDYVRWRWEPRDERRKFNVDRFLGADNDQALWRLWRAADMFRNASDYSPVALALKNQDIPNTLMSLDLMHNRALALATIQFVATYALSGDPINRLSKVLRAATMTRLVDEIAPASILADPAGVSGWVGAVVHGDELLSDDIPAPEDGTVPGETIEGCYALLEELRGPVLGASGKNYLLLRSNPRSEWSDKDKVSYHYGSRVHNYKKLTPGSRVLIFRDAAENTDELLGSAEIASVESLGSNGGQEEFVAHYMGYKSFRSPIKLDKKAQDDLRARFRHFNPRYSINYLDKAAFDSLVAPDA